jgi:hypothetical protein
MTSPPMAKALTARALSLGLEPGEGGAASLELTADVGNGLASAGEAEALFAQAGPAARESVSRCPSPLNVLKDAHDHSWY